MTCCGKEPVWVENVVGKGYHFCKECRNEVTSAAYKATQFEDHILDSMRYIVNPSIWGSLNGAGLATRPVAGGGVIASVPPPASSTPLVSRRDQIVSAIVGFIIRFPNKNPGLIIMSRDAHDRWMGECSYKEIHLFDGKFPITIASYLVGTSYLIKSNDADVDCFWADLK